MNLPRLTASKGLWRPSMSSGIEPQTVFQAMGDVSSATAIKPQACSCGGGAVCSCGKPAPQGYVYAIGSVQTMFPSLSVEKEFFQAIEGTIPPNQPPSDSLLFKCLSKSDNLYIAREMCWLLRKDGVDCYVVLPPSYSQLTGLIESIAPRLGRYGPSPGWPIFDYDVIVGRIGPMAPPEMCNGKELPTVICDEAFNFTDQQYVDAINAELKVRGFDPLLNDVRDVFFEVKRISDNTGDRDEYRAVNFLVVRYLEIYVQTYALAHPLQTSTLSQILSSVAVQPSPIQGENKILDVIFSYVERNTNVRFRYYCRVDVTGEYPFLSIPWSAYFSHP